MTLQDKIQHTKAIADAIQRADKSYDFEVEHGSGLFISRATYIAGCRYDCSAEKLCIWQGYGHP